MAPTSYITINNIVYKLDPHKINEERSGEKNIIWVLDWLRIILKGHKEKERNQKLNNGLVRLCKLNKSKITACEIITDR